MINGKLSILYVDANWKVLESTLFRLKQEKHQISCVDTTEKGIALYNEQKQNLDLVILAPRMVEYEKLLDKSVPANTGKELLDRLEADNFSSKKVLIFTCYGEENAQKAISPHKLEDFNYLQKGHVLPSDFRDIVHSITGFAGEDQQQEDE